MNEEQFEYEVMRELYETHAGERYTNIYHDDLGRLYVDQSKTPDSNDRDIVRLSLRQCALLAEYMVHYIDQLDNLTEH